MSSNLTEHARSVHVDQLLKEAARALEARRLGMALNAFRRAADVSLGHEDLRRRVFDGLLDGAGIVTDTDWRIAESMLSLAEGLNASWRAPVQIWQPIERAVCEEYVRNVLAEVSHSERVENLPQFRGRVVYALYRYPGEPRLQKRLELIDRALDAPPWPAPAPMMAPQPLTPVPIPVPEIVPAPDWSRAKGLGVAAAVILLGAGALFISRYNWSPEPADPAARTYVVPPAVVRREPSKQAAVAPPKVRTVVKVPVQEKKATTLAAKLKAPAPSPVPLISDQSVVPVQWNDGQIMAGIEQSEQALRKQTESREKTALALAASRKDSEDALALVALRAREQAATSNAVTAMLQQYVNAWNTKDVERIALLHRSLDRRTVKAQLAPVTAIHMTIVPTLPPQFEGDRATVTCRRQVEETFSDGTEKQSPESLVTFTLSKRDGRWGIDNAR